MNIPWPSWVRQTALDIRQLHTAWRTNTSDVATLRRIAYDLAAVPCPDDAAGTCVLCDCFTADPKDLTADVHDPNCPWVRAVDYVQHRRR